jgi:hypothetical protein
VDIVTAVEISVAFTVVSNIQIKDNPDLYYQSLWWKGRAKAIQFKEMNAISLSLEERKVLERAHAHTLIHGS